MASSTRDVVGFRKIFILFCTLVLLPALLMSSFVVVAINNEHQAELRRIQVKSEKELRSARASFANAIDKSDQQAREFIFEQIANAPLEKEVISAAFDKAKELRKKGVPLKSFVVLDEKGAVLLGEYPFVNPENKSTFSKNTSEVLRLLSSSRRAHLPISKMFFQVEQSNLVEEGALGIDSLHENGKRPAQKSAFDMHAFLKDFKFDSGILSVQRLQNGGIGLYLLDDAKLKRQLEEEMQLTEGFHFQLLLPRKDEQNASGALDRIRASVTEEQALAEQEQSDATLKAYASGASVLSFRPQPPFERFTLQVRAPKDERFTAILYVILALVCMSVLVLGVVLTSRLIWQEAKLSRLKTDFVSHVSHELRTPLTSIRMFIETLSLGRAASKEEEQECLDLLTKETERLSDMIERVLGYARLQSGKRTFVRRPANVEHLIDDAIAAFRAQYMSPSRRGESLELHRELSKNLPWVEVDPDSMVEALLNLLSNAYKYTGKEKEIRVFAERVEKTGGVRIGVRDNGAGLRKTEVVQVFERFYQAGALLSDKPSGSGLGLAITRGIVEANRGKISVTSEFGEGACFVIELRALS